MKEEEEEEEEPRCSSGPQLIREHHAFLGDAITNVPSEYDGHQNRMRDKGGPFETGSGAGLKPRPRTCRLQLFAHARCEPPLFKSETKFESRTGRPNSWSPIEGYGAPKSTGVF